MSRLHPFDYAFGSVADDWFGEVREEATQAGRDTADLAQFAKLASVQRILGQVQGAESADNAERGPESPEAPEAYVHLLFAGYRFWVTGRYTFEVTREAIERALGDPSPRATSPVPHDACYLRLPERSFWSQVDAGAPHEPLDGLFVVSGRGGRELLVVAVLGLRPERGGFSQITAAAVPEDLTAAAGAARQPLFEPTMDGGRVAGFRSIASVAELLLLSHLALSQAPE